MGQREIFFPFKPHIHNMKKPNHNIANSSINGPADEADTKQEGEDK